MKPKLPINDEHPLKGFFEDNPVDLRLTLVVFFLSIALITIPRFSPNPSNIIVDVLSQVTNTSTQNSPMPSAPEIEKPSSLFKNSLSYQKTSNPDAPHNASVTSKSKAEIMEVSPFDPNLATFESLTQLGLPKYVAGNWLKYINAGGQLNDLESIERIYGMTPELISSIKDKLILPKRTSSSSKNTFAKTAQKLEINTASVEQWQSLRGIGPVLSERIVKFRNLLGGFHEIGQISETYGLSDSTYQSIKSQLYLVERPEVFAINQKSEKELASHPYISYKQAKVISLYRKEHGPYTSIQDLLSTQILDSTWLNKMKPYLDLN